MKSRKIIFGLIFLLIVCILFASCKSICPNCLDKTLSIDVDVDYQTKYSCDKCYYWEIVEPDGVVINSGIKTYFP